MARRRSRRYYRRRSGKWSPNIQKISSNFNGTNGEFFNEETLAINNTPASNGVTQSYTVRHFEVSFTIEVNSLSTATNIVGLESMTAFIMYVPEGMTVNSLFVDRHPEWIMAYKYLGSPSSEVEVTSSGGSTYVGQQYQPFRVRTKLSRKLNTGDKIILYIQGSNASGATIPYNIDGIVRWWSKAN